MGVYVSAGVSGGHLNPAVSLALAISGKLSWRKIPYYMLGQYIGAFLGAASVYFVYHGKLFKTYYSPSLSKFEGIYLYSWQVKVRSLFFVDALKNYTNGNLDVFGPNATAGIYSTYPTDGISQENGFADQVFGTFLLLLCVRGITDNNNAKVPGYLAPFLVGLVVLNIGIAFGYNCGYAINPARDLSPRLFTLICGYGTEVFR